MKKIHGLTVFVLLFSFLNFSAAHACGAGDISFTLGDPSVAMSTVEIRSELERELADIKAQAYAEITLAIAHAGIAVVSLYVGQPLPAVEFIAQYGLMLSVEDL